MKRKLPSNMEIKIDDLSNIKVIEFLESHVNDMKSVSPPESKHALDINGLKQSDITFWTLWENGELLSCGALKELSPQHGEIKSMRTSEKHRGKGIASTLLEHIIHTAKIRGYHRISLETGSMAFFKPAHSLYKKHGFIKCAPFGTYKEDPNSVFMSKVLNA